MTEAEKNLEAVADIKRRLGRGELTLDEAKAELKPIVDKINAKNRELARKYKVGARLVSVSSILR
jgi:hypothetical protein|nr:MAG TPA: hypothetical protein [Caudoviricetes sp.]